MRLTYFYRTRTPWFLSGVLGAQDDFIATHEPRLVGRIEPRNAR
jgi:hypothetical protein